MIRLLVAVVVGAVLLATAMPAVERVRTDRANAHLERFTDQVGEAVERITRDTPVPAGVAGARRTVRLRVPSESLTTARVGAVRVMCLARRAVTVAYRVGGQWHRRTVTAATAVAITPPESRATGGRGADGRGAGGRADKPVAEPGPIRDGDDTVSLPTMAVERGIELRFRLYRGEPTVILLPAPAAVDGGSSRKPGPPTACSSGSEPTRTAGVGRR